MKGVSKVDELRSSGVELQHCSEFLVFYFLDFFIHAVLGSKELYKRQPQSTERQTKKIEKKKKEKKEKPNLVRQVTDREHPVRTWETNPCSMIAHNILHTAISPAKYSEAPQFPHHSGQHNLP